jgi:hypothetical protein
MATTKGIWVLTASYNDYDQHGEYYLKAWMGKPTAEDLIAAGVSPADTDHVLAGGGRRGYEEYWEELVEQT